MTNTPAPTSPTTRRRVILGALIASIVLATTVGLTKAHDFHLERKKADAAASASAAVVSAYASAQASATKAVPDGTKICDLLDSTDLEQRTGLQVISYSTSRRYNNPTPTFSCQIYFDQPNEHIADMISIIYAETSSPGRSLVEDRQDVADTSNIHPISMNDLPGEAVSYIVHDNENITWRSPNGASAHIGYLGSNSLSTAGDPSDAHEVLLHILYEIVPTIDEVAAGPPQPLTHYPASPSTTPTP